MNECSIATIEPLFVHVYNTNFGAPGNHYYTMKSFFRRPSWASRGNEDSAPDFYRRSKQTYADIIAATKEARERSTIGPASDYQAKDGQAAKCRRTSDKVCVRDGTPQGIVIGKRDQTPGVLGDQNNPPIRSNPGSHSVSQGGKEHNPHRAQGTTFADKNNTVYDHNAPACSRGPTSDTQSAGWKPRSHAISRTHEGISSSNDESVPEDLNDNQKPEYETTRHDKTAQENVVVQILISSEIENTKPLIVHRKMSQSLREVRLAWCKRQGFTKGMQSSVFLTWKGRRLFDVTTCKSLGVNTSVGLSDIRYPLTDRGTTRVHMEAVTEDLFSSKRRRRQVSRISPMAESQLDPECSGTENKEQDVLIKIVLKCPGLDDYGTRVGQKTQISHVISVFKDAQHIPAEKHVYLSFDGDLLDPDSYLVDYDIADLDLVDVLIR